MLDNIAETDADARVRRTARESAALTRLSPDMQDQKPEDKLKAEKTLADLHSVLGQRVLQQMIDQNQVKGDERKNCEEAIKSIQRYQYWVGLGVNLTNGLSAGSILILMALGLSIIYGQMGVINMAHGELMMLGAYATYEMQLFFTRHFSSDHFNWYYVAAFPFAFLRVGVRRLADRVDRRAAPLRPRARNAAGDVGRQPDPGAGRARAVRR